MSPRRTAVISCAVEGSLDEAVLVRLIRDVGGAPGPVYGRKGKALLRQKIQGYNNAARRTPWLVLVDLDHDAECAPPFRDEWLPRPSPNMCFRIAVKEIEAWLLADPGHLARFLGVPLSSVPRGSELLDYPKEVIVNLARRSRRREIREDMVPRQGSGLSIGPAYSSRLIEFSQTLWRLRVAERNADSLRRCRLRITELVHRHSAQ